jgi:hypothetical protein
MISRLLRDLAWVVLPVVALASIAAPARAQDNAATVEGLFDAGRKLLNEGKIAEACPKFLASYNLDHRLGTLLNLATCYEKNGQLATSWARFVEASTLAARSHETERATYAAAHAKALEPTLSFLKIAVPSPVPGLAVTRDGAQLDSGAFGVDVAVDGGPHTVEASAPGMQRWTSTVTVARSADHQVLEVPALVPLPAQEATATPTGAPVKDRSTQRIIGLSVAGAGVVGAAIGAVFGAEAISKNSDASSQCGKGGNANACSQTGVDLRHTALTDGTTSTILIGVGAAAIVGGVVVWLTGSPFHSETTVGFDGRQLSLTGMF